MQVSIKAIQELSDRRAERVYLKRRLMLLTRLKKKVGAKD